MNPVARLYAWASLRASSQLPRKASSAEVGLNVNFYCPGAPSGDDADANQYGFAPGIKLDVARRAFDFVQTTCESVLEIPSEQCFRRLLY